MFASTALEGSDPQRTKLSDTIQKPSTVYKMLRGGLRFRTDVESRHLYRFQLSSIFTSSRSTFAVDADIGGTSCTMNRGGMASAIRLP